MDRSIVKDVVTSTSKVLDSLNVAVGDIDLETSRAVLVKASTVVLLVSAARTRYATIVVTTGIAIAGMNYINHRFGLVRKVHEIGNILNKVKRCQ